MVDFEDVVTSEKLSKSELNEVSTKLKNVTVELSESSLELEAQRKENAELLRAVKGRHHLEFIITESTMIIWSFLIHIALLF